MWQGIVGYVVVCRDCNADVRTQVRNSMCLFIYFNEFQLLRCIILVILSILLALMSSTGLFVIDLGLMVRPFLHSILGALNQGRSSAGTGHQYSP